jgi:hypothetical protein
MICANNEWFIQREGWYMFNRKVTFEWSVDQRIVTVSDDIIGVTVLQFLIDLHFPYPTSIILVLHGKKFMFCRNMCFDCKRRQVRVRVSVSVSVSVCSLLPSLWWDRILYIYIYTHTHTPVNAAVWCAPHAIFHTKDSWGIFCGVADFVTVSPIPNWKLLFSIYFSFLNQKQKPPCS